MSGDFEALFSEKVDYTDRRQVASIIEQVRPASTCLPLNIAS
jgi:hypothetical protein